MEINLLKKPYEVSLSGNPVPFTLAISPYGSSQQLQDIRVQVRILIEIAYGSNIFSEVKNQSFYPTSDGLVTMEIQTILDPYLEYYTPAPNLLKPVEATEQRKRYKISWLLQQDGAVISGPSESGIFYIIKSGLSYESWHPSEFFTTKILAQKKPLLFTATGEKCGAEESKWIFWIYPLDDNAAQTVTYTIYMSDGTSTSFSSAAVSGGKWSVFCAPAGFNQSRMNVVVPAGLVAVNWSINVLSVGRVIVNEYFFEIDQRNFYDPKQLLYRNSIGGIETLRLRGQVDFAADYDRQLSQQTTAPSWYKNMNLLPQNLDENSEELTSNVGDTGFISKAACDKIRDLFLSKQKWELVSGKFWPINMVTKKAKFFSNKESLISTTVEWNAAFTNNFYTPDKYMPDARTCPAVQAFIVRQVSKTTLQISYALESPYDLIEVQVTISGTTYTYTYQGNTKTIIQGFDNPGDNSDITVKGRTVCDANSTPADYGPFSTVIFASLVDQPPVAVNDFYNIASGYSSGVVLSPSVLANDYDPDGDPLSMVIGFGTTAQGGSYTIDTAGIVTYTPPSSSFTGTDTFPYEIFGVIGGPNISALVTVNVGVVTSVIYVKKVVRNLSGSYGEMWIDFFSNPGGTVPYNATPAPFNITYTKTVVNDNRGAVTTTVTTTTISATGTKMLIYTGYFYHYVTTDHTVATSFAITPGAGYTII